jgi:hypothetical protein
VKLISTLSALALAAASLAAEPVTTYTLDVAGTQTHVYDSREVPLSDATSSRVRLTGRHE